MCARPCPVHAVLCAAGVEVLAKSLRTLNVSHNLVSRLGKGDVAMLKGAVPPQSRVNQLLSGFVVKE